MKLDTANRAFLSLLAVGLGVYMLGGIGACAVLSLLAYRFAVDGVDVLREGGITLPFALAFLTVVGSGTLAGLRSLRSQLAATRKLGDNVQSRRLPAPGALAEAAGAAGVSRRRVDVIDTEERFSFAYGLLFPRVALSRGLIEAATVEELRAVLEHERYHVRNFDPLKVLVARSVPAAFFYVPALRDLRLRYVAGRELAADRRAVKACGRAALAGALYKVAAGPAWATLGAAAALGGEDLLDARVTQLEEGREPPITRVRRATLVLSLLGVAFLIAALVVSLAGTGGPFATMRRAVPDVIPLPLRVAGMAVCGAFWAWVAWRVAVWLRRRRTWGLTTTGA